MSFGHFYSWVHFVIPSNVLNISRNLLILVFETKLTIAFGRLFVSMRLEEGEKAAKDIFLCGLELETTVVRCCSLVILKS